MANTILMDEFHVAVYARRELRADSARAIRRTLDDARFRAALRQAIQRVFDRYPPLAKVRVTLTR